MDVFCANCNQRIPNLSEATLCGKLTFCAQCAKQGVYQLLCVNQLTGQRTPIVCLGDKDEAYILSKLGLDEMNRHCPSAFLSQKHARCHIPQLRNGQTLNQSGVQSGAILTVCFQDAELIQASGAQQNYSKEYSLTFKWQDFYYDWQTKTIKCYGYQQRDDILEEVLGPKSYFVDQRTSRIFLSTGYYFSEESWPYYGASGNYNKYLCQLNPDPGTVFILELEKDDMPKVIQPVLYGCPTAKLPQRQAQLQHGCVEVVSYE